MLVVETFTAENIKLKVYATIGWGKLNLPIYFKYNELSIYGNDGMLS